MAIVVKIMGVAHSPLLPSILSRPSSEPSLDVAKANFARMRQELADARPDLLLVVGNDHLNQFFSDNMSPFLIGKAPRAVGPFEHEQDSHDFASYEYAIDVELARYLVADGFSRGVDFAFSDEFRLDHSFTIPLSFVRPEADLPIVPLFPNCMAPPVPSARRFHEVGLALRRLLDDYPSDRRIAVIGTGHLSVEIGGPKMRGGAPDGEFDRRMMALIAEADVEGLLREATHDRMWRAGNVTSAFLAFVMLLGVAEDRRPTLADGVFSSDNATIPFMIWEGGDGADG